MQTQSKKPHVGRNIQKIRLFRSMSQTDLATELEEKRHRPVSQQLVSDIEGREVIEDEELLRQVAEILHVSPEALTTLDLDNAINVIGSTFNDHAMQPIQSTIHQTINPLDKLIELFEKEKTELREQNEQLRKEIDKLRKSKK
jgi:transcriptional regulator with XRE-family HTH domain